MSLKHYLPGADPVRAAQKLIAADRSDASRLADMVAQICAKELWKARHCPKGERFDRLAKFVVAPVPYGLGVRTDGALRRLRSALISKRLFKEWVEVMEGAVRPVGHPKKNVADSEDLPPVFKRSRSSSSLDRILPRLVREYPDLFKEVQAGRLTAHRAAVQASILHPRSKNRPLRWGAVDVEALRRVNTAAQPQLLRHVFNAMGVDAQCALLAARLEGVVGLNTAQQWREHRARGKKDDGSNSETEGQP